MSSSSCPVTQWNTNKRTEFGRNGCAVFGWPSTGGVFIKEPADIVDLEYLGLDRFQPSSRSTDVHEENLFCKKMHRLGAAWWESEEDYTDVLLGMRQRSPVESSEVVFGWPSTGGVWVLRLEDREKLPKDFGKIHMALNMDERCRVIEGYGGTFYPNPEDVQGLMS